MMQLAGAVTGLQPTATMRAPRVRVVYVALCAKMNVVHGSSEQEMKLALMLHGTYRMLGIRCRTGW